ncbi:MAG TPA: PAS domain S-box protein [Burkholderiaceae bacterium]|jgi:PAS domain S-box-containing protein|nr:PAS domain S-box protein [Burkholderiaceae bacterium]
MKMEPGLFAEATEREVNRLARRIFLTFGVCVAVAGAFLLAVLMILQPLPRYRDLSWVMLFVVASWLLAAGLAYRGYVRPAIGLGLVGAIGGVGACATALQTGIQAPILSFLPVVIMLAGVLSTVRFAALMAALSGATVGALYLLEHLGAINRVEAATGSVPLHLLLGQFLPLASGLLGAVLVSRLLVRALSGAIEQEQRFKALLDIGSDWYWEQDAELRYSYLSDSFRQVTGVDPKERIGARRGEYPRVVVDEAAARAHRDDLEAHRPFRDFITARTNPDGALRYFSVSGQPRFDAAGQFRGYWGATREVTPDIQARQSLAASEERYRSLFVDSPVAIVLTRQRTILAINIAAAALFEQSSADLAGQPAARLFHERHRDELARRASALAALPYGRSLPIVELEIVLPGGRSGMVQAASASIRLADGPAIQTTLIDVSAVRRVEAALQHSEALLAQIYQTTADAVVLTDIDTLMVQFVNPGFTSMLGYRPEDIVGRRPDEVGIWLRDEERRAMQAQVNEFGETRDFQASFRRRDGGVVVNQVFASRFSAGGRRYVLIVGRDVTESERIRLLQQAILNNASIGIAVTQHRRFEHANPMFLSMFGWGAGELIGQPTDVVWTSSEEFDEIAARVTPALERGERVEVTERMRRRDGTLFWSRIRAQVLDPEHPATGGVVWISEDITDEREAQQALAAAKDQAEAASRAKSAFLANTSHEIRTPLNGVVGLARLARDCGDAKVRDGYLHRLVENAEGLSEIISDILDLSKIEAGKLTLESVAFDLPRLLESVYRAFSESARSGGLAFDVEIELHADGSPVRWVFGDPVRLRQILSNLVANAIKFTERGSVRLSARRGEGDLITFDVHDTGIGLDGDTASRLFTPFTQADVSTTRRFGGTGLGLSICKELTTLMGGRIGIDSKPGEGSRFWVEVALPAADPAAVSEADIEPPRQFAGARVLLVEDNELNRLIASSMLQSWDIDVQEAVDGEEALALVESANGRFDLVLMDIHMPGMSGYEATEQLRRKFGAAELPIVALTAAALASEQAHALSVGMNDFVPKPIDVEQLRTVVSRWLRRSASARDN